MTRHDHPELLKSILQLLTDEGSDAFAASLGILVNEAMRAERSAVLQAQPFERTESRTGYANGFKPKTLTTRLGPIMYVQGVSTRKVAAVLAEISDDWLSSKIYLDMHPSIPPSA